MSLRSTASELVYRTLVMAILPLNYLLSQLLRRRYIRQSVLHVSYMVHIPYYTTRILREHGMKADYLAIGESPVWDKCDYNIRRSRWPFVRLLREFTFVWTVARKYEILHLHFMLGISRIGWELPHLKRLGRKIVVHYRGCEIRNRERNTALHPKSNICQDCDYNAVPCTDPGILRMRANAQRYGDLFLVTTPDLKDFAPDAVHLPFFLPPAEALPTRAQAYIPSSPGRPFTIVHVTNHPGIEGTRYISQVMDRLQKKGFPIHFVFRKGISFQQTLELYATADLAIGKMKMGYYANSQIETLALGIPTITYVRPEFVTPEIEKSGLILSSLDDLEDTLEHYLTHPEALQAKRRAAAASVGRLHDNSILAAKLIAMYQSLTDCAPDTLPLKSKRVA